MAGIKGRSGIADTPEARAARAEAGRLGSEARRRKASTPNEGADPTAGAPTTLEDYDRLVGLPLSWSDAIKREQLVGEMTINDQRELAYQTQRGALLSREEVVERDAGWNAAADAHAELVFRLVDGIEGIPPAARATFLERAKDWRRALPEALKKAVKS